MDRISALPQPILHHILSPLPLKDAVKTCVLSKSWRYLGTTRPRIEFLGTCFLTKEDVLSDADKALQRYRDRNLSIQELILDLFGDDQSLAPFLIKWIPVHDKGLKIFRLRFILNCLFHLPSVIFQVQSLEELYLEGCKLDSTDKVLFRHLRTLSLNRAFIVEETLNKIFSRCPLIEQVVLVWCQGLTTIKVNEAHLLKRFECCVYRDVYEKTVYDRTIIEIDTRTLETIRISNYRNWYHHHNEYFPRLKSLCLKNSRLPRKTFDIFSSNFPCLEELELVSCDGFEEFELSSPSIKRLTVEECSGKSHTIDAPNLIYFEFSGDSLPSSFSFTTTSNELKSRIKLSCCVDSENDAFSTWLLKLNELVKALTLTQSHISLNLYRFSDWTNQITEDTNCDSCEPVQVENLIANYDLLSSNYLPASLNFLFRTCRPRYIVDMYVYMDAKSEFQREHNQKVESLCKILHKERETMSDIYFWLQDLMETSMEVFDENAKEWRVVQGTSLSECALSNNQFEKEIRIHLKWREFTS